MALATRSLVIYITAVGECRSRLYLMTLEGIKQSIRWKSYIRGVERAESHEAIVGSRNNRAVGARHEPNPCGGHHEETSTSVSDHVGDSIGMLAFHNK